jgi:hypothetical protein
MKYPALLFIVFFPLIYSCSGNSKKATADNEDYQKTRNALKIKEEKNPKTFLLVNGDYKKNLIGQTVIKGNVTNKASVAIFKDIDVNLFFYSKTKALLETDKETVFEVLHPGETKSFKTKYFAPKGTDSVGFNVVAAKVVAQ